MALFFDQEWFDAQLRARAATKEDVARLLKLTIDQIQEMWKDQRELMVVTFSEGSSTTAIDQRMRRQYWVKEGGGWHIFYERLLG